MLSKRQTNPSCLSSNSSNTHTKPAHTVCLLHNNSACCAIKRHFVLLSILVLQCRCICLLPPANTWGGCSCCSGSAAACSSNPNGALQVELGCFTAILSQRHSSQQQQQLQQQQQQLPAAADSSGYELVSVLVVLADGVPVPGEAVQEEPHIVSFRETRHVESCDLSPASLMTCLYQ